MKEIDHHSAAAQGSKQRFAGYRDPLAWAILLASLGGSAWAEQDAATTAQTPADAQSGPVLKAVTVTATRREESLQKIPVAVSVVDGEQLERDNRNNVSSIVQQVPTLNFRTSASNKDTTLFIRGVGTISTSPGIEPTVATVIDGVVFGRAGQSTLDLLDLERIEVLRGPQGTLFGKNASAGVLNVVTRAAPEEFRGYLDYSHFGNGNENRYRFGVGGRLTDTLKGSVSGLLGKYDGNVKNVKNGDDVNGYDRTGVRGRLEFEPNTDIKLTLIGDYARSDDDIPNGVVVSTRSAAFANALKPVSPSSHNQHIQSDYKSRTEDTSAGISGQLDWQLGNYTLTSITAWRRWLNHQYQDGDRLAALPLTASHDNGKVNYNQYTQEIRLASPKGEFLEYVLGVYYMHGHTGETYRRLSVNDGIANDGQANYSVTSNSFALFGENTFNFTDDFRGIVGLRWTRDGLGYKHRRVSTSPVAVTGIQPSTSSHGSVDEEDWSGRFGLQYDFTDNLMGYATYSRGYKGPAYNVFFNMQPRDTEHLKPETSDAYEIGLKTSALNNRLIANLAVFHTDYDNYQANFYDSVAGQVVTRLVNAGKVYTKGVELDTSLQLTPQLKLSGALAYTEARIDSFKCPAGAASNCNVNGKPLPFSPDWKTYVRADYSIPLDNGLDVELTTDYSWQDEVQFTLDQNPDTKQGAYGIWNASVALADYNRGWRVSFLGKNLNDKSYATAMAAGSNYIYRFVPRDDERYFGVQAHLDF
ncbi:TonB-dependent receptor [Azotobacter chroococcum]|uniref:TonB-dependent outer membrane receptor n=2 Tax=Azotobacter chroococcum TaxID=353 RepID=A0A0C4WSP4_9GAMM|nr:TonB-dependent receptor [Azotobacter chroococcum]AJE23726.1 TonB-dependent outer membrane receptor [Azotobacter chroococcum NCIMB 8003]QQE91180.1 TonB-dependent receptor [Azotobacter chroococcum]TKD43419.1 TonB-dependent receptor [Azotobacter chroococcum]